MVYITTDGVLHSVKFGILVGSSEQFLHSDNVNNNIDFTLKY